jgi:hypothetical protein
MQQIARNAGASHRSKDGRRILLNEQIIDGNYAVDGISNVA